MTDQTKDPRLDAWISALGKRMHERDGQLRFRPSSDEEWAGMLDSVIHGMFTEPMPPFPFAEVLPPETDSVTAARAALDHEDSLGDIGCVDRPADVLSAAETFHDAYYALLIDHTKTVRERDEAREHADWKVSYEEDRDNAIEARDVAARELVAAREEANRWLGERDRLAGLLEDASKASRAAHVRSLQDAEQVRVARNSVRITADELGAARAEIEELRQTAKPFLEWLDANYPTNDGTSGFVALVAGDPTKKMRAAFRAAFTERSRG